MTDAPRFAVDTNLLVYAEGQNGVEKRDVVLALLSGLTTHKLVLPAQSLGEFYHVMVRKFRTPRAVARSKAGTLQSRFELHAATQETFSAALDLAATNDLQFWDALILATAADARCSILLSEDLQDGFVYRGCTVANPFLPVLHPLLRDALEQR